jgi:hypothetical protein
MDKTFRSIGAAAAYPSVNRIARAVDEQVSIHASGVVVRSCDPD